MVKNFVIDTNVLMSNPNALFGYEENKIYLVGTVLQELDKHKTDEGERGYNARQAIKSINSIVSKAIEGKTKDEIRKLLTVDGIPLNEQGGVLLFEPDGVDIDNLPKGYTLDRSDNKIISSCIYMNKNYCMHNNVTLLTEDAAMYLNALNCGIHTENVRNEQIKYTGYSGHVNIEIKSWKVIDKFYKSNEDIAANNIAEIQKLEYPLYENQFVTLTSGNQSVLTVYRKGYLHKIPDQFLSDYKIKPLNKMQRYAIWALTNPDIPLVILEGPAGTAKTFLSMAAGLSQLDISNVYGKDMSDRNNENKYGRILISRPNNKTSDADFGYLPGSLEEKMGPLVASYMDNLEEILGDKDTPIKDTRATIEDMMYSRLIELCPLYAIRGRSIHNAYLICDEAQNATKGLIKDVVTRAGKNTKIIVAGDPTQIDNTSLSLHNNGLVYLKNCMKGDPLCAIIRFENDNCVRSDLAENALNRMK